MKKIVNLSGSLFFLGVMFLGNRALASVWETSQEWNSSWENQYSDWIKTNFNENFFTSGKWGGIATDCADAAYFARLIFSYENKLAFAMRDPTGTGKLISNKMSRFDDISDSARRLRSFMNYVGVMGSTETLPTDTYPIKINRENVRSGTVWSRVRITAGNWWQKLIGRGAPEGIAGHAETVKEVKETGAIYLIGSTVPQKVRPLILTSSFVFLPTDSSTGLRNWIWPQNYSLSAKEWPGYSREQFSMGENRGKRDLDTWDKEVQDRLSLRNETKSEVIQRYVMDLCSLSRARVEAVTEGFKYSQNIGRCMNRQEYEDFSTPTRDLRIKRTLIQLIKITKVGSNASKENVEKLSGYLDQCPALEIAPGRDLELRDYLKRVGEDETSSNPNDTLEIRWGLSNARHSHCPTYD